jgi:hypothetical protein
MELSQPSGRDADTPHHRWAGILGTVVAVLTIALPLLMIASYSPSRSNAEPLPSRIYSLPQPRR